MPGPSPPSQLSLSLVPSCILAGSPLARQSHPLSLHSIRASTGSISSTKSPVVNPPVVVTLGLASCGLASSSARAHRHVISARVPTCCPGQPGHSALFLARLWHPACWFTCGHRCRSLGLRRLCLSSQGAGCWPRTLSTLHLYPPPCLSPNRSPHPGLTVPP